MVPSAMRAIIAASSVALIGEASMVCSAAFRRRETSPISQFDTSLGCWQACAAVSKKAANAFDCVIIVASYSGRP